MSIGTCRSCNAPVRWVQTKKGKNMPLDVWPDEGNGNVVVTNSFKPVEIFATNAGAMAWLVNHEGRGPYTSHFATCPNAGQHRRPMEPLVEPAPEPAQVQEQLL